LTDEATIRAIEDPEAARRRQKQKKRPQRPQRKASVETLEKGDLDSSSELESSSTMKPLDEDKIRSKGIKNSSPNSKQPENEKKLFNFKQINEEKRRKEEEEEKRKKEEAKAATEKKKVDVVKEDPLDELFAAGQDDPNIKRFRMGTNPLGALLALEKEGAEFLDDLLKSTGNKEKKLAKKNITKTLAVLDEVDI
jgi:hypothetical protein